MVLESTMVCVDSSEYMRNGDYLPTRMQAQQDAVHMICHAKTRSNPENNLGLLTTSNSEVLVTLTADSSKVVSHLTKVKPDGMPSFVTSLRIAQLALKHRQGKSHKTRVIIFCGSPVTESEAELVKLAKRLKKEKVYVDVISFGEDTLNHEKLTAFMNAVNGKDGTSSNMVTISNGPMLSDALVSSPIILGTDKDGQSSANFEFGFDPNEDPELALALRVSMEEQRNRKGETPMSAEAPSKLSTPMETEEDAMLKQALGHGTTTAAPTTTTTPASAEDAMDTDLNEMTEEQQIAMAMRMSMAPPEKMEVDKPEVKKEPSSATPVVPSYENKDSVEKKEAKDVKVEVKEEVKEVKKEAEEEKSDEDMM